MSERGEEEDDELMFNGGDCDVDGGMMGEKDAGGAREKEGRGGGCERDSGEEDDEEERESSYWRGALRLTSGDGDDEDGKIIRVGGEGGSGLHSFSSFGCLSVSVVFTNSASSLIF